MKLNKVLCSISLFTFLAMIVHKKQYLFTNHGTNQYNNNDDNDNNNNNNNNNNNYNNNPNTTILHL